MIRHSIIRKDRDTGKVLELLANIGGKHSVVYENVGIVYSDLDPAQVDRLVEGGCTVSKLPVVTPATPKYSSVSSIHPSTVQPPTPQPGAPTFTPAEEGEASGIERLTGLTDPPLSGNGINVAVVDTGVRETHRDILGRVMLTKNCVAGTPDTDEFGHGTGVASVILGIAPSVNIVSVKVIGGNSGTEEDLVKGIDYLIGLVNSEHEYAPDLVNISVGTPDDLGRDSAIRVSIRELTALGVVVIAAAGNEGPYAETLISPAVDRSVLAVGSSSIRNLTPSTFSSRGPNPEGQVKPDCLSYGEDVIMASNESDTATYGASGTSFATPIVTGICALWGELFNVIQTAIASAEDPTEYLDAPELTPTTVIDRILPNACMKPEGISTDKDNAYGYGTLLASLVAENFEQSSTSTFDMTGIMGMIMPMMMMVMMIGMMSKMMGNTSK